MKNNNKKSTIPVWGQLVIFALIVAGIAVWSAINLLANDPRGVWGMVVAGAFIAVMFLCFTFRKTVDSEDKHKVTAVAVVMSVAVLLMGITCHVIGAAGSEPLNTDEVTTEADTTLEPSTDAEASTDAETNAEVPTDYDETTTPNEPVDSSEATTPTEPVDTQEPDESNEPVDTQEPDETDEPVDTEEPKYPEAVLFSTSSSLLKNGETLVVTTNGSTANLKLIQAIPVCELVIVDEHTVHIVVKEDVTDFAGSITLYDTLSKNGIAIMVQS